MYFSCTDFPNLEIYFEIVLNVYYFECPGGRDKKRYVTTTFTFVEMVVTRAAESTRSILKAGP